MSVIRNRCNSPLASHLLSLTFALTTFLSSIAIAQPAQAEKALRFTQVHSVLGTSLVTVAPNGFRLENISGMKFCLVAKAPDWNVTVFRNDDKTYYTESLKEFENTGLLSGFVQSLRERKFKDNAGTKSRSTNFELDGLKLIRVTAPDKALKYMPLNQNAEQLEIIDYTIFRVPTNGGFCIGYEFTHGGKDFVTGLTIQGRREKLLDTTKVERVDVSPATFTPPTNYTRANSLRVVVAGSSSRTESVDFQDLFSAPTSVSAAKQKAHKRLSR